MRKREPKVLEVVNPVPRFPIAVMHWYKQYSDTAMARAGTIEYACSLTPGLSAETAGEWLDKLIAEESTPTPEEALHEVAVKLVEPKMIIGADIEGA